jgi:hypothetical protein
LEIDADDRLQAGRHGGTVELDHGEQVALVRDGNGRHALCGGFPDQRRDPDRTVGQGIFRVQVEVDKG